MVTTFLKRFLGEVRLTYESCLKFSRYNYSLETFVVIVSNIFGSCKVLLCPIFNRFSFKNFDRTAWWRNWWNSNKNWAQLEASRLADQSLPITRDWRHILFKSESRWNVKSSRHADPLPKIVWNKRKFGACSQSLEALRCSKESRVWIFCGQWIMNAFEELNFFFKIQRPMNNTSHWYF